MSTSRVLIVGASVRAAAWSALRAGREPWGVDLFADRDGLRIARVARCSAEGYPAELVRLARDCPPMPWCYTGALENHPDVLAELCRNRELEGNDAEVIRRVRDPFAVERVLREASLPALSVVRQPSEGVWLRKPIASAGGRGIAFVSWADRPDAFTRSHYYQRYAEGPAFSTLFRVAERPRLLGSTVQLVGQPWLHAKPFAYCGSIGPISLPPTASATLDRFGCVLASAFGLWDLFGIDWVLSDGQPWLVEVNPRYTASVEVVELGCEHCLIGKALLFARAPLIFPRSGPWDADLLADVDPWRVPAYADIPQAGEPIEQGHPILTILTSGDSAESVERSLQERAAELDRLLFG